VVVVLQFFFFLVVVWLLFYSFFSRRIVEILGSSAVQVEWMFSLFVAPYLASGP